MEKINKFVKKIPVWGIVIDQWAGGTGLPDQGGAHPIAGVLKNVVMWLTYIFGFLGIIAFIIAGFLYLTAAGDTGRIEQSKKAVTYAIIGIVIGLIGLIAIKTIDSLLRG